MLRGRYAFAYALCGTLLAIGCSSESPYVPAFGKVNFEGKPLTSGVVMFQPPNGPASRGDIRPDGTFELSTPGRGEGARIGHNQVRISSREPQQTDGGEIALGRLRIPKRYTQFTTSGLPTEVIRNQKEEFVFELSK